MLSSIVMDVCLVSLVQLFAVAYSEIFVVTVFVATALPAPAFLKYAMTVDSAFTVIL